MDWKRGNFRAIWPVYSMVGYGVLITSHLTSFTQRMTARHSFSVVRYLACKTYGKGLSVSMVLLDLVPYGGISVWGNTLPSLRLDGSAAKWYCRLGTPCCNRHLRDIMLLHMGKSLDLSWVGAKSKRPMSSNGRRKS